MSQSEFKNKVDCISVTGDDEKRNITPLLILKDPRLEIGYVCDNSEVLEEFSSTMGVFEDNPMRWITARWD